MCTHVTSHSAVGVIALQTVSQFSCTAPATHSARADGTAPATHATTIIQNTARGGGAASRTLYCFEAERAGSSFETDRSDAFNA